MEPPDDSLRGWDTWGDVTPLERSVLLILAVAGRPLTRLYFPALLGEGRRPCPPEQADGAVDALLQRGLLVDTSDGVALPTESATLVLRHAALTGPWHVLDATARFLGGQASVRLAFCRSATNLGAPLDRELLDLENDRFLDPILFDLCLRPFDAPWFGRLPLRWQTMVARRVIPYALDHLCDVRPLLAKDLRPLPDDVCFAIGVHALMQGGKSQTRGWPKEAIAALASFLEGDSTAADAFDDARREYKAKNDTKPPHVLTLFHLLALHSAGRHLDAQRLARSVSRKSPLLRLSDALQGAAPVTPTLDDATVWELLFEGLLHAVSSTPLPPSLLEHLDDAALRARACGLLWIADQLDHLLGRRCTRWLPLPSLLQRNAPWEEVLRRLDEAAARGGSDRGRIVWTLRWDGTQVTSIEAFEQHPRGGTGIGWTMGRPVSSAMILDGSATRCATDQDMAVASAVADEKRAGYPRTLAALVGHPLVFWHDRDEPVEIVRDEPRLVASAAGDGHVHLCLQPACDRSFHVERDDERRLRLYAFTASHRKLADILGSGVRVPRAGHEGLVRSLESLVGSIAIESGLPLPDHGGADRRLYVRISPAVLDFTVQVSVRPLGPDGRWYPPGDGPHHLSTRDGRRAARDLEAEAVALRALGLACDNRLALEDILALLERIRALGDAVVTEWPRGAKMRVHRPRRVDLRVAGDHDWLRVEGDVEVDEGRMVPLRDLLAALDRARGEYVALGNGEFLALETSLRRRLQALRDALDEDGRIDPLALPSLRETLENATGDDAWREHARRFEPQPPAPIPEMLRASLRDYQLEGFRWLACLSTWGAGACLADDMGLGKTVQALALVLHRAGLPSAVGRGTLLVAPTSVCWNWLEEAERFVPDLPRRNYAGSGRTLDDIADDEIVVCSYGVLQQDADALAATTWRTVVLDEAQAIKNPTAARTRAALRLQAGFRLATTGTPVENHLGELWTLFRFLVPGLLGSLQQFRERHAARDGDAGDVAGLSRLVKPFILRRTKEQVLAELPPRTDVVVHVELGDEERALYEAVRRNAVERLGGEADPLRVLAELTRLRRACCHPRLVLPDSKLGSAKLDAFGEILDELRDNGHRALVFSQFVDHLSIVRERLEAAAVPYHYLDGSTPAAERQRRVQAFQNGEGDVFLISLRAGGTGLNLTAADYVVHLDPWWNPAVEDQASDRAHRLGQTRPVTVYRLVTRHTIEEQIVALHQRKRDLADAVLEGTSATARLAVAELVALLQEAPGYG